MVTADLDGIYSVELLCTDAPALSKTGLTRALQSRCPGIEPLARDGASELLAFAHTGHVVEYEQGRLPAQFIVFPGQRERDATTIEDSIQQSWAQPDARALVASAPHRVLVSDLMARGLAPQARLGIFLDALAGVLDVVSCAAIHWRASQQVLSPERFLAARRAEGGHVLFAGPLNVRFFNISKGTVPDEAVADTMGLAVLGLPDIQCHFHGLDVNDVIRMLYNTGLYLFEQGDVVEDGQTIPGARDDEHWTCQHEEALVPPHRIVLDVNPGPAFAVGRG